MFNDLVYTQVVWPCCIALAVLLIVRVLKKGRRIVRVAIYVACLLCIVEFSVFRNQACQRVFFRHLYHQVGWKQADSIHMDLAYEQKPWNDKYLAVGSSQVQAIFSEFSQSSKDLGSIHSAGMSPVEIWWYRDLVAKHCSDTVILYLSEFDITLDLETSAFLLSPQKPNAELLDLSKMLLEKGDATLPRIIELWIANKLYTFRYHFIADGLLEKIAAKFSPSRTEKSRVTPGLKSETNAELVESILTKGHQWFGMNLQILDQFIDWVGEKNLNVVIVQGQYHPKAEALLADLRQETEKALAELCDRHSNARFLNDREIFQFSADDYMDSTHTKHDISKTFAQELIRILEQPIAPNSKRTGNPS